MGVLNNRLRRDQVLFGQLLDEQIILVRLFLSPLFFVVGLFVAFVICFQVAVVLDGFIFDDVQAHQSYFSTSGSAHTLSRIMLWQNRLTLGPK